MKIWLTTDTHFGHRKMEEYCNRPPYFENKISENLFKNVKENDVLFHLGDICIGQDEHWHGQFIQSIRCFKKWLLRGNHDKKSNTWYLMHGWDWIAEEMVLNFNGKNILFSHEPMPKRKDIDFNIHGHIHNNLERLLKGNFVVEHEKERNANWLNDYDKSYHKLLALEETNYMPVNLESFISKF